MTAAAATPAKPKPRWVRALRSLNDRKMLAMMLLALAAGLPYGAVLGTLNSWLTADGVTASTIGALSLIILAYSYKFIWAPGFQKAWYPGKEGSFPRKLGPRRAWLISLQLLIAILIGSLALTRPAEMIGLIGLIGIATAISSATHDIVLDAWRIEVAKSDEDIDLMSALYQFGYRFSALLTGAVALVVAEFVGWQATYAFIGLAMLAAMTGALIAPEPDQTAKDAKAGDHDARPTFARAIPEQNKRIAVGVIAVGWIVSLLMIGTFVVTSLTSAGGSRALGRWASEQQQLVGPEATRYAASVAREDLKAGGSDDVKAKIMADFTARGMLVDEATIDAAIKANWTQAPSGAVFIREQGPLIVFLSVVMPALIAAFMLRGGRTLAPRTQVTGTRLTKATDTIFHVVLDPLMDLINRLKWAALLVLALVLMYRFADLIWGAFAYPFYQGTTGGALGHSNSEVALASKTIGVVMIVFGSAVGAAALLFIGRMSCLFIGAVLAAVTNLIFADLALGGAGMDAFLSTTGLGPAIEATGARHELVRLIVAIAGENLAVGFASVAITAYMTGIVNPKFAAVQYALLGSLTMLIGSLGRAPIGAMIDERGFHDVFVLTAWLGGVAVVLSAAEWARQAMLKKPAPKPSAEPAVAAE